MELFTNEDICHIIRQLGFNKALNWLTKRYSDELIGYLGEHLTLTVEVESGVELKLFVKCLPRLDGQKAEYLKETTFFDKEYAMLNSLFPKFKQGTQKWRPAVYMARHDLFVFEDVSLLGYAMPRDRNTLTAAEVKASVVTMARFHAQSYIYEESKSKELNRPYRIWEDYSDHLQEPSKSRSWRNAGMNAVIDYLKVYSKYKTTPNFAEKVDAAITKLFSDALYVMKPHHVQRNVVVHRDLWMNNLFFKNDGDSLQALFVDFQTVLYCPPMLDLSSFLYFNTRRDFRDKCLSELIDLYFLVLSNELKMSNIDVVHIIDRESLENWYKESITFGISQGAIIVPLIIIDENTKDTLFSTPKKVSIFYEVSRSAELIKIAEDDDLYRNHVTELFDEIVEKYVL